MVRVYEVFDVAEDDVTALDAVWFDATLVVVLFLDTAVLGDAVDSTALDAVRFDATAVDVA